LAADVLLVVPLPAYNNVMLDDDSAELTQLVPFDVITLPDVPAAVGYVGVELTQFVPLLIINVPDVPAVDGYVAVE